MRIGIRPVAHVEDSDSEEHGNIWGMFWLTDPDSDPSSTPDPDLDPSSTPDPTPDPGIFDSDLQDDNRKKILNTFFAYYRTF